MQLKIVLTCIRNNFDIFQNQDSNAKIAIKILFQNNIKIFQYVIILKILQSFRQNFKYTNVSKINQSENSFQIEICLL